MTNIKVRLTKRQLDYIAQVCGKVGQDKESVIGIDIEWSFEQFPIGFKVVTNHPNYKNRWIKLDNIL